MQRRIVECLPEAEKQCQCCGYLFTMSKNIFNIVNISYHNSRTNTNCWCRPTFLWTCIPKWSFSSINYFYYWTEIAWRIIKLYKNKNLNWWHLSGNNCLLELVISHNESFLSLWRKFSAFCLILLFQRHWACMTCLKSYNSNSVWIKSRLKIQDCPKASCCSTELSRVFHILLSSKTTNWWLDLLFSDFLGGIRIIVYNNASCPGCPRTSHYHQHVWLQS